MNEVEFKVGDLVYCPHFHHHLSKLYQSETSENLLAFETTNGNFVDITRDGKIWSAQGMVNDVFPATQQWYKLLSKLYPNVNFEKPLIRKSSKDIIQALLDNGNAGVLCWVSDALTEPNSNCFVEIITEIGKYYIDCGENTWLYATPIMPIKSLNQTIIDYKGGELILENNND